MLGRIIGISLIATVVGAVVMLAFFALLSANRNVVGIAWPEESTAARTAAEANRFSGETSAWLVRGQLVRRGSGSFEVELRVTDKTGRPAPDEISIHVLLSMPGHPMPPLQTSLQRLSAGIYRVTGEVSMYGLWRARIALPDGIIHFPVDIGP